MNLGHILFNFSGRINRAKWWLSILAIIVIYLLVIGASLAIANETATMVLFGGYFIVMLWITFAAGAKRLHDLNRTAAWLVLFIGGQILLSVIFAAVAGMAIVGALVSGAEPNPTELARVGGWALIISTLTFALALWMLIWFGCLRGTVGPNQYGPDPLEGRV